MQGICRREANPFPVRSNVFRVESLEDSRKFNSFQTVLDPSVQWEAKTNTCVGLLKEVGHGRD